MAQGEKIITVTNQKVVDWQQKKRLLESVSEGSSKNTERYTLKTQINQNNQKINRASKVYPKKLKAIKVLRNSNASSTATRTCSKKADFFPP